MNIICQNCGKEFVFNEAEQEFYKIKGFPEPKRCKPCRDARKARRLENNKIKNGGNNNGE